MTDITITDIQRLVVHPGEALLVRVPAGTSPFDHEKIIRAFRYAFPDMPVFVIINTVEFSVVAREDA